jgi:hypothetical protein
MTATFSPPLLTQISGLDHALRDQGYAVLDSPTVAAASGCDLAKLNAFNPLWNDLPPDTYLKDGGHYRRRRHSCFVVDGHTVTQAPHRPHWQPVEYNALHGGMLRHFAPMLDVMVNERVGSSQSHNTWQQLLVWLGDVASARKGLQPWFVEAHQFRIDTSEGIGRPTPEGAHRDGVDFVAVFLVDRVGVKGGETRVFDATGPAGQRFTLTQCWSLLLLDDARVIHESTPIQPIEPENQGGYRDTLVVTLRRGGFQGQF